MPRSQAQQDAVRKAAAASARNRRERAERRQERDRARAYQRTQGHHWSCTCEKCEATGVPITPDPRDDESPAAVSAFDRDCEAREMAKGGEF